MKTKAIVLSLVLLVSASVFADVPDQITYQGRLLYNGSPVTAATSIVFRLYQTSSGGSTVWTETLGSVTPDSNGIYTVVLGETVAVPDDYDSLWLELVVAGNVLTPRKKLTSAPFVLRAGELPSLYVSGNVGIGTTSPSEDLEIYRSGVADADLRVGNDWRGIILKAQGINNAPTIRSTGSGNPLYIAASDDSSRNILIAPSGGDVGIGTANPGAMLHIENTTTGRDSELAIFKRTGGDTDKASLKVGYDATHAMHLYRERAGGIYYIEGLDSGADFRFVANNADFSFSGGNVGIGTTDPGSELEVNGDINFTPTGMPSTNAVGVYYAGQGFTANSGTGWIHVYTPTPVIPIAVTCSDPDWGFSHDSHDTTQGLFSGYGLPTTYVPVTGYITHTYHDIPGFAQWTGGTTYPNLKIWVTYLKQ